MDASPPPAHCHGAFSLTGRWHVSSRVAAVLTVLFLVLCNVPGQYVERLELEIDPYWRADYKGRYEHGWPFTFLNREAESTGNRTILADPLECWAFWRDKPQLRYGALVFNILAVGFAALIGGGLFEVWRRRQRRLAQFHLIDVLAATTLVACALGWYLAKCREYAWDQALIRAAPVRPYGVPQPTSDFSMVVLRSREGGITWLRRSLGHHQFDFLDRVIAVEADHLALRRGAQLSSVESLRLRGEFSNDDLANLKQYRRLEVIELTLARQRRKRGASLEPVELPKSASVRALHLEWVHNDAGTVRGFKNLRSLESLKLEGCRLDATAMRELGSLAQLRQLSLGGRVIPENGCVHLGGLSNLERLTVHGAVNDEESLRAIGKLTQLRELTISGSTPWGSLRHLRHLRNLEVLKLTGRWVTFDEESLRAIGELSDLRQLVIPGCTIPRGSLCHLRRLQSLEVLEMAGAEVAPDELGELKALRRLKVLDLRGVPLRQPQYEMLLDALPDCEIR